MLVYFLFLMRVISVVSVSQIRNTPMAPPIVMKAILIWLLIIFSWTGPSGISCCV